MISYFVIDYSWEGSQIKIEHQKYQAKDLTIEAALDCKLLGLDKAPVKALSTLIVSLVKLTIQPDPNYVEPEVLDTLDPTMFDIYYYVDNADAVIAGDLALTAPDFPLT